MIINDADLLQDFCFVRSQLLLSLTLVLIFMALRHVSWDSVGRAKFSGVCYAFDYAENIKANRIDFHITRIENGAAFFLFLAGDLYKLRSVPRSRDQ